MTEYTPQDDFEQDERLKQQQQFEQQLNELSPAAEKCLRAVTNTIEELKKHHHQSFIGKYWHGIDDLPWVFLLGTPQSGKSSLILDAEIDAKEIIFAGESTIAVYRTKNAIYLELPGEALSNQDWHGFWAALFSQCKSLGVIKKIKKIALLINLARLIPLAPQQRQMALSYISDIFNIINEKINRSIDVTIVFTHFDLLAGCREFFADSNCQQRYQPFGFTLESCSDSEALRKAYQKQFQHLLAQTQQRVLPLLHDHANVDQYNPGQDFPVQLESIEALIQTCLTHIWHDMPSKLNLIGMYFVANRFQGVPIDNINHAVNRLFKLVRGESAAQKRQNKAFFSHKLVGTILPRFPMNEPRSKTIVFLQRHVAGAVVSACLLTGSAAVIWQFNSQLTIINQAESAITEYQVSNNTNHNYQGLNRLAQANSSLDNINPLVARILPNIHQLKIEVAKLYQKALETTLLNPQARAIEHH